MSKTVAIIGVNGLLGKPTIDGLLKFKEHYKLPIRILTRDPSSVKDSEQIKYYSSKDQLDEALKDVDVLIDLTSAQVDSKPFIDAAVKAGVKVYFPSEFGTAYIGTKYEGVFAGKKAILDYARSKGLKTVQLLTGLFAKPQFVIAGFNIDDAAKSVRIIDNGEGTASITSLRDIGYTLGSLAYRDASELPDELFIQGNALNQNEIVALYEKYKKVDLIKTKVTKEQILQEADEAFANLKTNPAGFLLIIRAYIAAIPNGLNNPARYKDNQFVNPEGKFWQWETFESVLAEYTSNTK